MGPAVEVQKNPGSSTWYDATIADVNGSLIRVEFGDEVWPSREVPSDAVRRCPIIVDEAFAPKISELVEVAVAATETNPSGWTLGRVKKIKNKSFYFVAYEGAQRERTTECIVERDSIRQVNAETGIDSSNLRRKIIPVDRDLHAWIRSQDSQGCLNDVQIKGKLLTASCTHTRPDAKGPPKVALVGDERAVELGAKLLVDIHFKNQIKMQRFHEHREKLMEHLAHWETRNNLQNKEVFFVDSSHVGKIIGKGGEHIKHLREAYEVNINIQDPVGNSRRSNTTITITGKTAEAVRKAREDIEYVTEHVPIEPEQVGWIVGKGYQNLIDIQKKADLQHARFDDRAGAIELCGLRHQVENAKLMISLHREYLPVYQDMKEERDTIQAQFSELDEKEGGKGKKGGKKGGRGGSKGGPGGKGAARGSGVRGKGKGRRAEEEDDGYGYGEEEESEEEPAPAAFRNYGNRRPAGRGRKGRGK
mmetsp:Transcript_63685/g.179252  ORF Transcript_63685/g.179252 Transcript_63685/m.179252 type:complete len:476 (+) Transcript_63685:122-1549(+)